MTGDKTLKKGVMRDKFSITHNYIYFNSASRGPYPDDTKEYIKSDIQMSDVGFSSIEQLFDTIEKTRLNCAKLINSTIEEISLTYNTSLGLNTILSGLGLNEGDEILILEDEFPAIVYSAFPLKRRGVQIKFIEGYYGYIPTDEINKHINEKTRVLAISWVNFYSGLVNNLKGISQFCKKRDIYLVVDAVQGLGPLTMDVGEMGLDLVACGAQKWLLSPEGSAFIYVSGEMMDRLKPCYDGWLSVDRGDTFFNLTDYAYKKYKDARRFFTGTVSEIMAGAMNKSIETLINAGLNRIQSHTFELSRYLREGLKEKGYSVIEHKDSQISGITTILTDDYAKLGDLLAVNNIIVSSREGYIRFSPYLFNTIDEIEFTLSLL
jgi:selenocysteine lyase/cysteine desulfurase